MLLGYDTGLYRNHIQISSQSLPFFPDLSSQQYLFWEPVGLFIQTNILSLLGLSVDQILVGFYLFVFALIPAALYITARVFLGKKEATFALFLFLISITQFEVFFQKLFKNNLAIFLLLISFYLLKKRSYLVILTAGFMGGVHHMTFLPFGVTMLLSFFFTKEKKYYLISGAGIILIALSLYIRNFEAFLGPLGSLNPLQLQKTHYGGIFMDIKTYLIISSLYLPFAIWGLWSYLKRKNLDLLLFFLLSTVAIVFLRLYFHKRFIIHLDIAIIFFASYGLSRFVEKFWKNRWRKAVVMFLLGMMVFFNFQYISQRKTSISNDELSEIKTLSKTEANAYVMALSAYYSPWLYGFSERPTIAPGRFEYDQWDKDRWQKFWETGDLKMLDDYPKPLYLYIGDHQPYLRFEGKGLQRYSKRIYKYVGK